MSECLSHWIEGKQEKVQRGIGSSKSKRLAAVVVTGPASWGGGAMNWSIIESGKCLHSQRCRLPLCLYVSCGRDRRWLVIFNDYVQFVDFLDFYDF